MIASTSVWILQVAVTAVAKVVGSVEERSRFEPRTHPGAKGLFP